MKPMTLKTITLKEFNKIAKQKKHGDATLIAQSTGASRNVISRALNHRIASDELWDSIKDYYASK